MTARERIAAIEARATPVSSLRQGSELYIPQRDFAWLLARLKRAEELLDRAYVGLDLWNGVRDEIYKFRLGAEDESK